MRYVFLLLLTLAGSSCFAQKGIDSSFIPAQPPFSEAKFALHYFNVGWNDEQWKKLAGRTLELGYVIDDIGEPFLINVLGVQDSAIIDSLARATAGLPYFKPALQEGNSVRSNWRTMVTFPGAATPGGGTIFVPLVFQELSEEELLNRFELTESERLIRFGILGAAPLGPVADYVNFGGGLSMEFIWQQENGLGYGGGLGLTFHRRERAFPGDPFPDREDRSSGAVFISGYVSQALIQQSRKRFTAQAQLGYGQFNGANKIDDIDASFLAYRGVDVGLSLNYTFLVGKYAPVPLYATQQTRALGQYHGIVLIAGLRYQWLNNPLARSAYPFFGVGYQFGTTEFRRKD